MTWRQLLARAWAVWKLRRTRFFFCKHCSSPLTIKEVEDQMLPVDVCSDCFELQQLERKAETARQQKRYQAVGGLSIPANTGELYIGGISGITVTGQLSGLLGGLRGSIGELGQQQSMEQQMQQQQMNMRNDVLDQIMGKTKDLS